MDESYQLRQSDGQSVTSILKSFAKNFTIILLYIKFVG